MKEFDVNREVMDYLESLFFDLASLKTVNVKMLNQIKHEGIELNKEIYKFFIEDYKETNAKFEILKKTIMMEYAPDYIKEEVTFDFESSKILIKL